MKKMDNMKKIYNNTKIPNNLSTKIMQAFNENTEKKDKRIFKLNFAWQTCGVVALSTIILLNTNQVFAESMGNLPIIGKIAQVLTIREYEKENEYIDMNVEVPEVSNLENKELEERVNNKINEKINELLKETNEFEEEVKIAVDTNSNAGSVCSKLNTQINYEVKCNNGEILSFILAKSEGINTTSDDVYTYNYNIKTGKEITLEEVLENDYNKANIQIQNKIDEAIKNQSGLYFTKEDEELVGKDGYFSGINEKTKFYINEKQNPTIVFNKYEIAPGYMGIQEFEIVK